MVGVSIATQMDRSTLVNWLRIRGVDMVLSRTQMEIYT
jgi:hypothetical protein